MEYPVEDVSNLILVNKWPFPINNSVPELVTTVKYKQFLLSIENKKEKLKLLSDNRKIKLRKRKRK